VRGGNADDGHRQVSYPSIGGNVPLTFPHRARTQEHTERWIPSQVIPYDPYTARMCGGAAPGLVFCWLEYEFLSGQIQAKPELVLTFAQMLQRTGMRQSQFSKAFARIGVIYRYSVGYRRARLSGTEFWCKHTKRYLFYSMEITDHASGPAAVRRNSRAIDTALGTLAPSLPWAINVESGAKKTAQLDAKRLFGL
jgi:hypothetical protein